MDYDLETLHKTFTGHAQEYRIQCPNEFNLPYALVRIIEEIQALHRDIDAINDTRRDGFKVSRDGDTQSLSGERNGDNTYTVTGIRTTMDDR